MIVGFTGLAGSGKSTAAQYLVSEFGFVRHRFAGPLKSMLHCLGLNEAHTDGDLKEVPHPLLCGKSPRQIMQLIGTEFGRELIGPSVWINVWKHTLPTQSDIVCDDVRFANEAEAVRRADGIIVRIDRPGLSTGKHKSERMEFEPDVTIANHWGVEQLESAVERLVLQPAMRLDVRPSWIPGRPMETEDAECSFNKPPRY